MKIRFNFACIAGLICLSVQTFTSPLSAALIIDPANNANFANPSGLIDVTVNVNIPASADSVQYYINDYRVSNDGDNNSSFEFNFLQGGSYTVKVEALDNDTVIETDSVDFTVDYRPLTGQYNVRRMNGGKPIIDKQTFIDAGAVRPGANADKKEYDNINGPTVIRIPDWITPENRADPTAIYYCYFSHHQGQAIYLAWAENIEGPWTLYNVGPEVSNDKKGVLAFDNGGSTADGDQRTDIGNGLTIRRHMASPDILIDDANQRIVMFFHGPYEIDGDRDTDQSTFAAECPYGLSFWGKIGNCIHGSSYMSMFKYKGELYAMDGSGTMYHHPDQDNILQPADGSFDYSKRYWEKNVDDTDKGIKAVQWREGVEGDSFPYIRHIKTFVDGDTLYAAYSATRGVPERLFYVTLDLSKGDDWKAWHQAPDFANPDLYSLARAEAGWEGGHFPVVRSEGSSADEGVNQLRDPQFFRDIDGKMYMFYAGQGEDAIGMARLLWGDEVDEPIPDPTVEFADLSDGDIIHFGEDLNITGILTGVSPAEMRFVYLRVDDVFHSRDNEAPFTFTVTGLSEGSHSLILYSRYVADNPDGSARWINSGTINITVRDNSQYYALNISSNLPAVSYEISTHDNPVFDVDSATVDIHNMTIQRRDAMGMSSFSGGQSFLSHYRLSIESIVLRNGSSNTVDLTTLGADGIRLNLVAFSNDVPSVNLYEEDFLFSEANTTILQGYDYLTFNLTTPVEILRGQQVALTTWYMSDQGENNLDLGFMRTGTGNASVYPDGFSYYTYYTGSNDVIASSIYPLVFPMSSAPQTGRDLAFGITGTRTATGFDAWMEAADYPIDQSAPDDDLDGDGDSNFHEYAFGGNVNDSGIKAPRPFLKILNDGGVNNLAFIYSMRTDTNGLAYVIETTESLTNTVWEPVALNIIGSKEQGPDFSETTNAIPMDTEHKYYRVRAGQE